MSLSHNQRLCLGKWAFRHICLLISINVTPAGSISSSGIQQSPGMLPRYVWPITWVAQVQSSAQWEAPGSALSTEATNTECRLSRRMTLLTHTVWNSEYPLLSLDWVFILECSHLQNQITTLEYANLLYELICILFYDWWNKKQLVFSLQKENKYDFVHLEASVPAQHFVVSSHEILSLTSDVRQSCNVGRQPWRWWWLHPSSPLDACKHRTHWFHQNITLRE